MALRKPRKSETKCPRRALVGSHRTQDTRSVRDRGPHDPRVVVASPPVAHARGRIRDMTVRERGVRVHTGARSSKERRRGRHVGESGRWETTWRLALASSQTCRPARLAPCTPGASCALQLPVRKEPTHVARGPTQGAPSHDHRRPSSPLGASERRRATSFRVPQATRPDEAAHRHRRQ